MFLVASLKMSLNSKGTSKDLRKLVLAQDRSRVNGGASSYDQMTSQGQRTSRVQGHKNVRARKEPKDTARDQDKFQEKFHLFRFRN